MAETFHSGGIIGADALPAKFVSPEVFAHAKRFHTGGLVGGEIPIIANRGEGIFTPEQMKRLAPAGNSGPINISVAVDNGGRATAHADGGAKAGELGRALSGVMRDFVMKEKRPGGLLA